MRKLGRVPSVLARSCACLEHDVLAEGVLGAADGGARLDVLLILRQRGAAQKSAYKLNFKLSGQGELDWAQRVKAVRKAGGRRKSNGVLDKRRSS